MVPKFLNSFFEARDFCFRIIGYKISYNNPGLVKPNITLCCALLGD
jgi:hypothetical protein